MKHKHVMAAGSILGVIVAGSAVCLWTWGIPGDGYQGFNVAKGALAVLSLLSVICFGFGIYGLCTLRKAEQLIEDMEQLNTFLQRKVNEMTVGMDQTVQQLNQEIEQRRLLAEQLKTHTTTDSLTGLLNRGTGMALLVNQMHMSERCQWPLTIWSVNIDNLKQVKDKYGYDCGDQMVREVSRLIQSNIRKSDTLFRMGDDELMVILPQCTMQAAEAIRDRINITGQLDQLLSQYEWQPALSHGLAEYQPGCRIQVTDFIQKAGQHARIENSSE